MRKRKKQDRNSARSRFTEKELRLLGERERGHRRDGGSSSDSVTLSQAAAGLFLRALWLFCGVLGLNLFFFDALRIAGRNDAGMRGITVDESFFVLWAAVGAIAVILLSLTRVTKGLTPLILCGGMGLWLIRTFPEPLDFVGQAGLRFWNLVMEKMGQIRYTTYSYHIVSAEFSYDEELLIRAVLAAVILLSSAALGAAVSGKIRIWGVVLVAGVYLIPVFLYNISRKNLPFGLVLIFLCGTLTASLYEGIYSGEYARRRQKREAKRAHRRNQRLWKRECRQLRKEARRASRGKKKADRQKPALPHKPERERIPKIRLGWRDGIRLRGGGGFAAASAMLAAAVILWFPMTVIDEAFPIIEAVDRPMETARAYMTAVLLGDDLDLNAMNGSGAAELKDREVDFASPDHSGANLFTVTTVYPTPVYLRGWIGTDYDLASDKWSSADAEEVVAYRERFGGSFTPDNIRYFYNLYVHPRSVSVQRLNYYLNFSEYGFRAIQVHVKRLSGSSRILYLPSMLDAGRGVMQYDSTDAVKQKYSAFYDGIYSSRFFGEGSSYSATAFSPVMKSSWLGANLEISIEYYNLAQAYAERADLLLAQEGGVTEEEKQALILEFRDAATGLGFDLDGRSALEAYFLMSEENRERFHQAYRTELNYRDYTRDTYTESFGSQRIADLAEEILAGEGIVCGSVYEHDKSAQADMDGAQLASLSSEERWGNSYGTWFTNGVTGDPVPRHKAILAVLNYFRHHYTYTLTPVQPEGDEVCHLESFLFDTKEGYCTHFATAAAALLREMGFAVRYCEGYLADDWSHGYGTSDGADYKTTVRDYDAHAWVEVYYPAMGWIPYECTPPYFEEIYDNTSSAWNPNDRNWTTSQTGDDQTEEKPEDSVEWEDEADFTLYWIVAGIALLVILTVTVVLRILRVLAMRAVRKRRELVMTAVDEAAYTSGATDVHRCMRGITDAVLAIYAGLGCPRKRGELPQEYAARIRKRYPNHSAYSPEEIMTIMEKEEFGGSLTYRELSMAGRYLEQVSSAAYASLRFFGKIRARYFLRIL